MSLGSRFRGALDVTAAVVMIAAGCVILWPKLKAYLPVPPHPAVGQLVPLSGAPIKGKMDSGIGIVEFSDFECPFCGKWTTETGPPLEQAYIATGKAFLAFKHLPLVRIHTKATFAAQAAACAGREGQFWGMHDRLFAAPDALDRDKIQSYALVMALSPLWTQCISQSSNDRVAEDLRDAERLKIGSTPAFLIGRMEQNGSLRVLSFIDGAKPIDEFMNVLDGLVAGR